VIPACVQSDDGVADRRRSARAAVGEGSWFTLPSAWTVQLLDVSLSGLAFVSPLRFETGRIASVRATLGGEAFTARIRVCWSAASGAPVHVTKSFTVGAAFLPLEDGSRRALHTFLKVSPPNENQHAKHGR